MLSDSSIEWDILFQLCRNDEVVGEFFSISHQKCTFRLHPYSLLGKIFTKHSLPSKFISVAFFFQNHLELLKKKILCPWQQSGRLKPSSNESLVNGHCSVEEISNHEGWCWVKQHECDTCNYPSIFHLDLKPTAVNLFQ